MQVFELQALHKPQAEAAPYGQTKGGLELPATQQDCMCVPIDRPGSSDQYAVVHLRSCIPRGCCISAAVHLCDVSWLLNHALNEFFPDQCAVSTRHACLVFSNNALGSVAVNIAWARNAYVILYVTMLTLRPDLVPCGKTSCLQTALPGKSFWSSKSQID